MVGADRKDKKGFAGLSGLVSEVDLVGESHGKGSDKTSPSQPQQVNQPQQKALSRPQRHSSGSTSTTATTSSGKRTISATEIWILVVGLGIGLAILATQRGGDNNKTYSQPTASVSQRSTAPQNSAASLTQATAPAVSQNSVPDYTMPPVGTNKLLGEPEIQWCIKNGIRIGTIRGHISTNVEIDAFNRIVNDHNSRCGNYQYRKGAQAQAERTVEPYRSQIVAASILEAKQLGRSQPVTPQPAKLSLSDQEYHRLMRESDSFRNAENRLSAAWKVLKKNLGPQEFKRLQAEQRAWLKNRGLEVQKRRQQNLDLSFAQAYALVTESRVLELESKISLLFRDNRNE